MATPEAVGDHYQALQRLQVAAMGASRALWGKVGNDFDPTYAQVARRLFALVAGAQLAAAQAGAAYVPQALAQQNVDADPDGAVRASGLSGTASDGRGLDTLLEGAVIAAKEAVGHGATSQAALALGGRWLDMIVRTQVTDAARQAASVAIAARPQVGWTRMVNPPCCGRCALLAGKFYRYSSGFQRHPRCDCVHIPCVENTAGDVRTNPRDLFAGGHVQGLSRADARAITDGADYNQVVNAHRGMATAQVYGRQLKVTTEGTTRRGQAYRSLTAGRSASSDIRAPGQRYRGARAPRLMPESIYRIATDRDDALRLLRLNGYLT